MRVFLTGASGILGTDIKMRFQQSGHEVLGFSSNEITLHDGADVDNKIQSFKPDLVIHSAAMTNVDQCEDDKALAYAINVTASENIARSAQHLGARLVYISSCGVYGDQQSRPHRETDVTMPLNYHHQTKLEGESKVKDFHDNPLIIRPGWLFGGTVAHRKNFVEARRREAIQTATLNSTTDKVGSPTYTFDLANQIATLIDLGLTGIFNAVNEGCASRFEYVSEIIRLLKLGAQVLPVDSKAFPRKANMPANECLENANLKFHNCNHMRHWKDALENYINITYK